MTLNKKFKVATILGIRPDYIRTSNVLKLLKSHSDIEATFISTGQHYDRELKDIFLEQLNVPPPDITLDACGATHCEQHSKLILQLEKALLQLKPDVCLFLGDANAVMGCIAPLKLGIPIAHIEAGMRSYDWRMPEERNRVIIDRVSDVLYVYHENYKVNLVREGINPSKIVTVGNIIVDILYDTSKIVNEIWPKVKEKFGIEFKNYALLTMHRSENVENKELAQEYIFAIEKACDLLEINKIILPQMPRLKSLLLHYPERFHITPPLGYLEFSSLEQNAAIEFTDSGTNQEVAAIREVPCVVLRKSTERPETFESNISILSENPSDVYHDARKVLNSKYNDNFSMGDGKSSIRIVDDLLKRLKNNTFNIQRDSPYVDRDITKHFFS